MLNHFIQRQICTTWFYVFNGGHFVTLRQDRNNKCAYYNKCTMNNRHIVIAVAVCVLILVAYNSWAWFWTPRSTEGGAPTIDSRGPTIARYNFSPPTEEEGREPSQEEVAASSIAGHGREDVLFTPLADIFDM